MLLLRLEWGAHRPAVCLQAPTCRQGRRSPLETGWGVGGRWWCRPALLEHLAGASELS